MRQPDRDSALVDAYLRHYTHADAGLAWAWQELDELVSSDPARAWTVTLRLIAAALTTAALAYVAAGPLEDLLQRHAAQFIDELEGLARRDPKFRRALQGAWNEAASTGPVHHRILRAIAGRAADTLRRSP